MTIRYQCACGAKLKTRDQFAGMNAECPCCGETVQIPEPTVDPQPVEQVEQVAMEISDFLEPPPPEAIPEEKTPTLRKMFEALLDPRSIQWMLMLGGGLAILGLIVWLVSLGIFESQKVVAIAMGLGTLGILAAGWFVTLKTKYRTAGQALTFLGCVIAPLNLWFYHTQGLVLLEHHLWIGGVVCSLLYLATLYVLRDPLFMYAIEGGITLTVMLFLAELGFAGDATFLSCCFMVLGFLSVHAERIFPIDNGDFTRKRFGMPLFWSGHTQVAISLAILFGSQVLGWLFDPNQRGFGYRFEGNPLTDNHLLAGALWLAGTYLYLYSDIVVRRIGLYTFLSAFCLVLAEVTLIAPHLHAEGLIAILALTAVGVSIAQHSLTTGNEKLRRALSPIAMGLSCLAIFIGLVLHFRATGRIAHALNWSYETSELFIGVMLIAALANRVSAHLCRHVSARNSATYFFLSAGSVIVAAAGLLRIPAIGLTEWTHQAPLLMLIPIGYMVASRLWRGHSPERPLCWVAQTATAVILASGIISVLEMLKMVIQPIQQQTENLMLGIVFAEATVFYILAAMFRKRSDNVFLAAAAACGALWQFMGYWGISGSYYTMIYAVLGIVLLIASRFLGIKQVSVFQAHGGERSVIRGRGMTLFQSGNAILTIAFLAAFLQGLARIALRETEWLGLSALLLTTVAGLVAAFTVPRGSWRQFHIAASIGLAGLAFLTFNVLLDLTGWQKLEIFCVAIGVAMLVVAHVGHFRETDDGRDEMVGLGLTFGSLLAVLPLLIAVIYHRAADDVPSLYDEIGILTITILMLVSGVSWQLRVTTLFGGGGLFLYLIILITSLAYHPQVAIGVYLAVGGVLLFAIGIGLSMYREKLLELPEQLARREGIFRIMEWR